MPSEKYLSITYLMCFVFSKRNAIQIIYLLCKNVKKVDRLQPNDKCKERNNSVSHLTETKFVTSRESSGRTLYTFKTEKSRRNIHI